MGSRSDFVGVVVAAGSASRFGDSVPKQFQRLGGATLLERAVTSLGRASAVSGLIVVLAETNRGGAEEAAILALPGVRSVVSGGATRAESVRAGLRRAADASFVLVHDAARPLAELDLVEEVIRATRRHGAAVPGLPVADTVKRVESDDEGWWVSGTVERGTIRLAQTPQGARTAWLSAALEMAARDGRDVTDEASALEAAGHRVFVVAGDPRNRKITTAADLAAARREMTDESCALRIGTGFDIHRFGATRPLMLGGVHFEGEPGLEGHSDADVVLHAAMDALLGAAAEGDIGMLFPPDDPRYAGADSRELAAQVAARVRDAGFTLVNLDLTLLAERPRIRTRVDEMRQAIASCLGVGPDRIGLKATTCEGLGALGRTEGAACQAVALLSRKE